MLALSGRLGFVLLVLLSASPLQAAISLTTMNIRYYGLNADESRDPAINRYLDDNGLRSDVLVFQEIVDVERLTAKVVGLGYVCTSYDNPARIHQHVVVCLKSDFRFDRAEDDDDFVLENVAMGNVNYRPAVHGIIRNARSGRRIAHLVAVHLKAMPQDGAKRIEQMQMIHDYLAYERVDSLPAIVVGDTNLFPEDQVAIDEIVASGELGLKAIETPGRFTYRIPEHGQRFDRVWTQAGLRVVGVPKVAGPCNLDGPSAAAAILLFNKEVSDHCAVSVQLNPSPR